MLMLFVCVDVWRKATLKEDLAEEQFRKGERK